MVILVPSAGSTVTVRAPKGALGNADPAAEFRDLPGRPALQSATVSPSIFSDRITLDVLGSALRNPAGRKIYEAGSWGYLPWAASLLALACAARPDHPAWPRRQATPVNTRDDLGVSTEEGSGTTDYSNRVAW